MSFKSKKAYGFLAQSGSTGSQTGTSGTWTTLDTCFTTEYDPHGMFNGSTGLFTSPCDGVWLVCAGWTDDNSTDGSRHIMMLTPTSSVNNDVRILYDWPAINGRLTCSGTKIIHLAKGETMDFQVRAENGYNTGVDATQVQNWFGAFLIAKG